MPGIILACKKPIKIKGNACNFYIAFLSISFIYYPLSKYNTIV